MKPGEPSARGGVISTEDDLAVLEDLRPRLRDSRERELASRTALTRAVRELALMRRVARFETDGAPPTARAKPGEIPRCAPLLRLEQPIFHMDVCENRGAYTFIAGWAFHPSPAWNARDTAVTLLLQNGAATYYAATGKLLRPDVAAHFAAQSAQASGGAHGLDGVGFASEILHLPLTPGEAWQVGLRLECGRMVCEAVTGQQLRW